MALEELRAAIDEIDDEMTALFARRMALAEEVAALKRESGGQILRQDREIAIVTRLCTQVDPRLCPSLRQFYAVMFEISREWLRKIMEEIG